MLPGSTALCPAGGCLGLLTDRMQMRFPVLARRGECEIETAAPLRICLLYTSVRTTMVRASRQVMPSYGAKVRGA